MARHLALLPALWAISAASGCGYDPLDERTQITPQRAAVVGTWTPEAMGRKDARDAEALSRAKVKPSIVLNADGTFAARDLPDGLRSFERSAANGGPMGDEWDFLTGSGTWKLEQTGTTWIVRLNFTELPSYPGGLGFLVTLYGQEPPYRLGIELSDPDEGRRLMFHQSDRGTEETAPAPKLRKVRPAVESPPEA